MGIHMSHHRVRPVAVYHSHCMTWFRLFCHSCPCRVTRWEFPGCTALCTKASSHSLHQADIPSWQNSRSWYRLPQSRMSCRTFCLCFVLPGCMKRMNWHRWRVNIYSNWWCCPRINPGIVWACHHPLPKSHPPHPAVKKSCFLHRMNDSSRYCWPYLPRLQSPLSRHMTWKNFVLRRLKALCYRQSLYQRLHICRYRVWHLTRERIFRQRRWQSVRHHNNCRDSAHRHHQNLMYRNCHHSPQDYICRFLSPLNPYHRLLPCRHRN